MAEQAGGYNHYHLKFHGMYWESDATGVQEEALSSESSSDDESAFNSEIDITVSVHRSKSGRRVDSDSENSRQGDRQPKDRNKTKNKNTRGKRERDLVAEPNNAPLPPSGLQLPASLRCALCDPTEIILPHQAPVHIDSDSHQEKLAAHYGKSDSACCEVVINGRVMLFDNYVVFPQTIWGPGSSLFDNTLHMLLVVDACGGIRLRPGHRYTVVMLAVAAPGAAFEMTATQYTIQAGKAGKHPSHFFDLRSQYREPRVSAVALIGSRQNTNKRAERKSVANAKKTKQASRNLQRSLEAAEANLLGGGGDEGDDEGGDSDLF